MHTHQIILAVFRAVTSIWKSSQYYTVWSTEDELKNGESDSFFIRIHVALLKDFSLHAVISFFQNAALCRLMLFCFSQYWVMRDGNEFLCLLLPLFLLQAYLHFGSACISHQNTTIFVSCACRWGRGVQKRQLDESLHVPFWVMLVSCSNLISPQGW